MTGSSRVTKEGIIWLNTTKQLHNKSVPELSECEHFYTLYTLLCRLHVLQHSECQGKTNYTDSASDKSLMCDLCISKHDATAVSEKKKKKKTSSRWGLFISSGLIYPRGFVLLYSTKRKPDILAQHQGSTSTSAARPTGFPVPQREHGNSDGAGVNMGKKKMKNANRQNRAARSKVNSRRGCPRSRDALACSQCEPMPFISQDF